MIKNYFTIFNGLALLCFSFPALAMYSEVDGEQACTLRNRRNPIFVSETPEQEKANCAFVSPFSDEIITHILSFLDLRKLDQRELLNAAAVCHSWRKIAEEVCSDPNQPYPKYINLADHIPPCYPFFKKFWRCQYNLAAWAHGSNLMPLQPPQVSTSLAEEDLFSDQRKYWLSGKLIKEMIEVVKNRKKENSVFQNHIYPAKFCENGLVLESHLTKEDNLPLSDSKRSFSGNWKIFLRQERSNHRVTYPYSFEADDDLKGDYHLIDDYQLFKARLFKAHFMAEPNPDSENQGKHGWRIVGRIPNGKNFIITLEERFQNSKGF